MRSGSLLRKVLYLAMLIAMEIILSRFLSIATPLVKIGFSFIPLAVAGMLFGPFWAGAAGAAADFIGAVLFPIGAYFPGFTLTAFLNGFVYGLCLHRDRIRFRQIILAAAITQIILSLGLNTYWVYVISHSDFVSLLSLRAVQSLVMIPMQIILLPVFCNSKVRSLLMNNRNGTSV